MASGTALPASTLPVASSTPLSVPGMGSRASTALGRALVLTALLALVVTGWFSLFNDLLEDSSVPRFWMAMRLLNGLGVAVVAALGLAALREWSHVLRG